MSIYEPMDVKRVDDEDGGSHIEPPLDPKWGDLESLRWNAGVMKADTGLTVKVTQLGRQYGLTWRDSESTHSTSVTNFFDTWRAITCMCDGAELAQRGQP